MVPPALLKAVFHSTRPPVLVPSIVPAFVTMLASVRTVSATDWLALMTPLVWLTRNMFAPPPIAPAPEIVLSTLTSVSEPALPKI